MEHTVRANGARNCTTIADTTGPRNLIRRGHSQPARRSSQYSTPQIPAVTLIIAGYAHG